LGKLRVTVESELVTGLKGDPADVSGTGIWPPRPAVRGWVEKLPEKVMLSPGEIFMQAGEYPLKENVTAFVGTVALL
jgi:hypothetical protein